MVFSDLELSKRLERAEGYACVKFAEARNLILGWLDAVLLLEMHEVIAQAG
jgi:hypothetical protein